MITAVRIPLILILILTSALTASRPHHKAEESAAYLGFDRNDYPGDGKLQVLRRTFSYSGYWLNAPPGEKTTSWTGKRYRLLRAGFGFLVLYNGKTDAQIRAGGDPKELGNPMRWPPPMRLGRRDSAQEQLSFSIWKRVGDCCPSRRIICMPGLTPSMSADFAPACIVQAFRSKRDPATES